MSYQAIAAAFAIVDVSAGERLVALSFASYANREHRAWPGARLAAARAGMSKSQFLEARDALARRGLLIVESEGGGRGQSAVVRLVFAEAGPWCEHEINAALLDAVLSHSRLKGSARVLLAALAACADRDGVVAGISTEELCAAAGMGDRTYRRARTQLLASGEVALSEPGGGRARTNQWVVVDPRTAGTAPVRAATDRPAPPAGGRPLMASAKPPVEGAEVADAASVCGVVAAAAAAGNGPVLTGVSARKGPILSGVSDRNGPVLTGVSARKGPILTGVSDRNGPDLTGVSRETPAETPAQTPAPNARAGRESLNPLTRPPQPPASGGSTQIQVVEEFLTDKGRRRQRTVTVDVDQVPLSLPSEQQRAICRSLLAECERIAGTSTFEIWLAKLDLAGISEQGELLLAAPPATAAWIRKRFGRLFDRAGDRVGCRVRLATPQELQLLDALTRVTSPTTSIDHKEAV